MSYYRDEERLRVPIQNLEPVESRYRPFQLNCHKILQNQAKSIANIIRELQLEANNIQSRFDVEIGLENVAVGYLKVFSKALEKELLSLENLLE